MRNKVYRTDEDILSFTKAKKQRIVVLFDDFTTQLKGI